MKKGAITGVIGLLITILEIFTFHFGYQLLIEHYSQFMSNTYWVESNYWYVFRPYTLASILIIIVTLGVTIFLSVESCERERVTNG